LKNDPCEYDNIAKQNLEIVEGLRGRLEEYVATVIPEHSAHEIEEGNPCHFGGAYSPGWCESEP